MAYRSPRLGLLLTYLVTIAGPSAGCQRLPADDDDVGSVTGGDGLFGEVGSGEGGANEVSEGGEDDDDNDDDAVPTSECDPVAQSGCSGEQKCTATVGGAGVSYRCVTDAALGDMFGPCQPDPSGGVDNCPVGYVCLGVPDATALCVPLCNSNNDCNNGICVPDAQDNVPYCADQCSPFENTCPAPSQCRRAADRFACKIPQEFDFGGIGDACTPLEDAGCGAGLVCLPGELAPGCEEPNCCVPVCDLSGPDSCQSPSTCARVLSSAAPGFESVGACFVPA